MFCIICGAQIPDNAGFCPACGSMISPNAQAYYQQQAMPQNGYASMYASSAPAVPPPGFSSRVNDPEIMAAMKKSRKGAAVFGLILVPLPFLGFLIFSLVSDKMEVSSGLLYGGIISGVFLLFAIYSLIHERAGNTYDAVVLDKKIRHITHNNNSDHYRMITEYITTVKQDSGKKRKIVEREGSQVWAYNYLNVGDRFRYHPQFHFPYELYDKSKAPYIVCVSCTTRNPVTADRCQKCRIPLLR